jgi:hypothetical protein
MPAQGNEATLIRRKTGDTSASFSDADIDLLFDEAESSYSGYSRSVIFQAVVVARLEELWTAALVQVTYKQNEASENLSDIAKALEKRFRQASAKLDNLIASEKAPAVGFASIRYFPTRDKDVP